MKVKNDGNELKISAVGCLPAQTVVSDFRHPTVSARTQFNAMAKQL